MKINAIRFRNKTISAGQESELKAIILFSALFASGMILGAGLYKTDSNFIVMIKNILSDILADDSNNPAFTLILSSITINIVIYSFILMSGFSCTGIPFIILLIFAKGLGYGLISGYLFNEFGLTGIGYYLIIILFPAILLTCALILTSSGAVFISAELFGIIAGKKASEKPEAAAFLIKTIPCIAMTVTASVLSVILRMAFSGLFLLDGG